MCSLGPQKVVLATSFRAEVDMGPLEVCGGRFGASPKGLLSEPRSDEPRRSPEGANFASREAASGRSPVGADSV